MDVDYGRNLDRDGGPFTTFEPSLFVWATVMSGPAEDRAIVDAGLKALAFDSGPPARLRRARRDLRARVRRARPARRFGGHQPPRARRQDPADPRPLRPGRQPLRLVCRLGPFAATWSRPADWRFTYSILVSSY
jgi:hypothetical protein